MSEWLTLREAAEYAPIGYQSLLLRAHEGRLAGARQVERMINGRQRVVWVIRRDDAKRVPPRYIYRRGNNRRSAKGFGRVVRALRLRLGFRQREAAELVGVSPEYWSNWERGRWMPRAYDVARLMSLVGVSRGEELSIWRAFAKGWLENDKGRTKRKYRKEWL